MILPGSVAPLQHGTVCLCSIPTLYMTVTDGHTDGIVVTHTVLACICCSISGFSSTKTLHLVLVKCLQKFRTTNGVDCTVASDTGSNQEHGHYILQLKKRCNVYIPISIM